MLTCLHPPPDETPTLPPHLLPHNPLRFCMPASSSPCVTILTLLRGPQAMPPTPPSPLLTPPCHCLILSTAYHTYACGVPSQHTSHSAYHCYTCEVPSQHASNAAYNPYA
ncbi:hypothetical protein O181_026965 [Austropuccinia psidii MF-1]|uniref:Uncharacterized protein n=1 Tax=Austropuccinia psidii MF-1 TaxID=1389203 RepID=A0A9Q3CQF1_9BASI|nr:hypothetical protein [Austropuccinia psidii MF-1]